MKYLEHLFITFAVLALVTSFSLNLYLLSRTTKERQYKKEILLLMEKRNNTSNLTLETLYTDSINNAVKDWLKDGTDK